MSERWPRLGYEGHQLVRELEYLVPEYDADWLLYVAERIESGQPLGPLAHNAAACFRQLAETPASLKELNDYERRIPREVRGLNRAAHCVACLELRGSEKKKEVRHDISTAWRTADETIRDDVVDFGKRAQALIESLIRQSRHGDRRAFLEAFDADMVDRAVWMSKSAGES